MTSALATMPSKPYATQRPMARLADITGNLDQLWNLANMFIESRMLPNSIDTPQKALTIILKGDEIGIPPMLALEQIVVIQGKPTISPQLMLALIEKSGQLEDMLVDESPDLCSLQIIRRGRSASTVSFSRADAVAMGLAGKDNWKKQFGVMMYWRAVSKMARRLFPDIISGLYTPEEMDPDISVDEQGHPTEPIRKHAVDKTSATGEGDDGQQRPPSPTGKGSGMFTKEHLAKTADFVAWMTKQCQAINAKWHQSWEPAIDKALEAGQAVPDEIADVINPWQAKGHLFKWGIDAGFLAPEMADADPKTRQTDAIVAKLYQDHKQALIAEMGDYIARHRTLKQNAIYRKHPDLAPDGWAEEQAEAVEAVAATTDDAWAPGRE